MNYFCEVMAQQTTVQMLIWELERGFQELMRELSEISEKETKWKLTAHSKTVDVLDQFYEKRKDWISESFLGSISTIEFKVVHLAQWKQRYHNSRFTRFS